MHKWGVAALAALITLAILGVGTASAANKTIKVGDTNNNSLNDVQNSCLTQGGMITSWTFIINQIRGPKPATISVTFQGVATPVSASVGSQGGASNAHYTVTRPAGGVVTNATASIVDTWRGQFVLSHVTCVLPTANVKLAKTFETGPFTVAPANGSACFTLAPNSGTSASQQCSNTPQWNGLTVGNYTITETTVPAGYVAITPINFKVALDCTGAVIPCVVASQTPLTLDLGSKQDILQKGYLSVLKKLGPAPGSTWTGTSVNFNVCANDPVGSNVEQTPVACAAGVDDTLTFPGDTTSVALSEGYYTVCEVVPTSYVADDECQVVQVVAGEAAAANLLTFINTPVTASVSLTKSFEEGPFTDLPAADAACFTLNPNPGPDVAEQCTTTPEWGGLTVGSYTISETETPDGYETMDDIEFTVAIDCTGIDDCIEADTSDSLTNLGEVENELLPGALSVVKELGPEGSAWDGPNVTFNVCAGQGVSADDCADDVVTTLTYPGGALSGDLDEGWYTVCEVVPAGYIPDDECLSIDVVAGETAAANELTFVNTLATAGVQLTKTFQDGVLSETPVEGDACFTLTTNTGPDDDEQCTNTPEWTGLTVGTYTISETTVPDGYAAITDIEFTVAIDCTGVIGLCVEADTAGTVADLGEFEDSLQDGFLSVLKLLGPAPGSAWVGDSVTFNVCANSPLSSNVEQTAVACAAGVDEVLTYPGDAESGALAEGYYTVCEVVPTGYAVDNECQVVEVLAGETAEANVLTFINTATQLEGCSPGYWKGELHLDDYNAAVAVLGSQDFHTLFGPTPATTGLASNLTLLQAVDLGGGGSNQIARSGAAALLSAAHPGIDYAYSQAQVIAAVQAAFDGDTVSPSLADLDAIYDVEGHCPLS